jgi:hypothetical protein
MMTMQMPKINMEQVSKLTAKMKSNITAGANDLYAGAKGVMLEKNLVSKAENKAVKSAAQKEANNYQAAMEIMDKGGNAAGMKQLDTAVATMIQKSPHSAEIIAFIEGKTKALSPEAQKDLAAAFAAANQNGGALSTKMTQQEQFQSGVDHINNQVRMKTVPQMANIYYAQPFAKGAKLVKNYKAQEGNLKNGLKSIGVGTARVGATAGVIGGSAYAVHSLTSNYREDYKKNTGSKDF